MLADHNLTHLTQVNSWNSFVTLPEGEAGIGVLPLETGFEANIVVITEQDVFGDRLVKRKATKKPLILLQKQAPYLKVTLLCMLIMGLHDLRD